MFAHSNAARKTVVRQDSVKKKVGWYPFPQIPKIIISKLFYLDYKVTVVHLASSYFITCDVWIWKRGFDHFRMCLWISFLCLARRLNLDFCHLCLPRYQCLCSFGSRRWDQGAIRCGIGDCWRVCYLEYFNFCLFWIHLILASASVHSSPPEDCFRLEALDMED